MIYSKSDEFNACGAQNYMVGNGSKDSYVIWRQPFVILTWIRTFNQELAYRDTTKQCKIATEARYEVRVAAGAAKEAMVCV